MTTTIEAPEHRRLSCDDAFTRYLESVSGSRPRLMLLVMELDNAQAAWSRMARDEYDRETERCLTIIHDRQNEEAIERVRRKAVMDKARRNTPPPPRGEGVISPERRLEIALAALGGKV